MYQFYFFTLAFIIVLNKNITSPILVEPLNACSVNAYIICLLSAIFVINLFHASIVRGKDNCPFIENMLEKHIDQFLFYPVCLCNLTLYFYPCI